MLGPGALDRIASGARRSPWRRAGRACLIGGWLALASLPARSARAAGAPDEEPGEPATSPHPVAAIEAGGASGPEEQEGSQLVPKFATGFLMVTTSTQAIPAAPPRNQLDYALQGIAGVAAAGTPWEKWDYLAYLIAAVSADAINGTGGSVAPDQITLRYSPQKALSFQVGYMRMPFSLAQSATITSAMFPARPEPTQIFQAGSDAGVLAAYEPASGLVRAKAGLFDGLSLGLTIPQHVTRGPVVTLFAEVAPFGAMKQQEADFGDTPLRVALSGSLLYRSGTAYDPSGYAGLSQRDTRFTGALRFGYKGVFVQGEYLQAVQTDDLSSRPRIARGAYGEGSYYAAIHKKVGLSPIARLGWSAQDADFFPLHIVTFNAGMALYPRGDLPDPSALRFVFQYRSERHIEEKETGYGALASVMLRF
jgi:hypothetical protein